ncbi:MAG: hypothetical protein V1705_00695 [bacterium]
MGKTRLVLGVALAVAVAVVVVLLALPLEGWQRIVVMIPVGVAVAFSIAAVILLAVTVFKVTDDLWESDYFRYMRIFWGRHWGGTGEILQISVCRATWLSVMTLIAWMVAIGLLGVLFWITSRSVMVGINALVTEDFFANFVALVTLAISIPVISFIILFVLLLPGKILKKVPRVETTLLAAAIVIFGAGLICAMIVAPIRSVGLMSYLIALAWVFGSIAGVAAVIMAIVGIVKLAVKASRTLSRETVPGRLAEIKSSGWKQKICPLIIQGRKQEESGDQCQ